MRILDRHENAKLAEEVAKAGAVEHLSNCVQDPDPGLERVAVLALCEIAKHNAELANGVASNDRTLKAITAVFKDRDVELKQNACTCLANIAKHNEEIAQKVASADLFPGIIDYCLKDDKPVLQRQAMQCIKEIAGQSVALAKFVVDAKAVGPIVDYLGRTKGSGKLPAVMTLGFIAGFDKELAKTVVQLKGHKAVVSALKTSRDGHVRAAAAWSLGQMVRHSPELAKEAEEEHLMDALLAAYNSAEGNSDLQSKSVSALRNMVQQCQDINALTPLIASAPEKILEHILGQVANLLRSTPALRRPFADEGHLSKLQELKMRFPDAELAKIIAAVNDQFPADVVQYFTKGYMDTLMKQEDEHHE